MKRRILIPMLFALTSINLHAQIDGLTGFFSKESFTLGQSKLAYRKATINEEVTTLPSLVLYLHGGTFRGEDNEAQLNEVAVDVIYQYLTEHGISAIMIVPQCPTGGGWTSQLRRVVNELAKSFISAGTVDEKRIYVMGGSMGGTGTWTQLSYFPNFYAAAMPVAGNPTGLDPAKVATTPVLTVMGTADRIMSIPTVEAFVDDIKEADGIVVLDIEESWTHENTCELAYTDERLAWLFSQVRAGTTGVCTIPVSATSNHLYYDLSGRIVTKPKSGIYIRDGKKIVF